MSDPKSNEPKKEVSAPAEASTPVTPIAEGKTVAIAPEEALADSVNIAQADELAKLREELAEKEEQLKALAGVTEDRSKEVADLAAKLAEKDALIERKDAQVAHAGVELDKTVEQLAKSRAQNTVLSEVAEKASADTRKKEGAGKPDSPFVVLARQLDRAETADDKRDIKRKIRELAETELDGVCDMIDVAAMIHKHPKLKVAFLETLRDEGFIMRSGSAIAAAKLPGVLENELLELTGGAKKYF